jgi:hypothetical protein
MRWKGDVEDRIRGERGVEKGVISRHGEDLLENGALSIVQKSQLGVIE